MAYTWLNSTKRFTNLKVNLKRLGLYIGAKIKLFLMNLNTYFYQCIMTFWGPRDSKGPILKFKINDIDPERRFVNLFGEFSPLCGVFNAQLWLSPPLSNLELVY